MVLPLLTGSRAPWEITSRDDVGGRCDCVRLRALAMACMWSGVQFHKYRFLLFFFHGALHPQKPYGLVGTGKNWIGNESRCLGRQAGSPMPRSYDLPGLHTAPGLSLSLSFPPSVCAYLLLTTMYIVLSWVWWGWGKGMLLCISSASMFLVVLVCESLHVRTVCASGAENTQVFVGNLP